LQLVLIQGVGVNFANFYKLLPLNRLKIMPEWRACEKSYIPEPILVDKKGKFHFL